MLRRIIKSQRTTLSVPTDEFSGATVIITGANTGLGLEAARHIVRLKASKVILAVRNIGKGEIAKQSIEETTGQKNVVEVWQLDLTSLESVQSFAKKANELPRVDVLLENAGVGTFKWSVAEGHETTITVNVISTYLLALLMIPKLRESATKYKIVPRLSIVGSDGHEMAKFSEREYDDIFGALKDESKSNFSDRYDTSKLITVLMMRELAAQLSESFKTQIILNSVNPGWCYSDLARDMPWFVGALIALPRALLARTTEVGSRNLVFAVGAAGGPERHGSYMQDCQLGLPSEFVMSPEGAVLQRRVYDSLMKVLEDIQPGISENI